MTKQILISLLISCACLAQTPDTLWTKTYGNNSEAWDAKFTSDGGTITVGTIYVGSESHILVVRTNALGVNLWQRQFGVTGIRDRARAVIELPGGQFVVVGSSGNNDPVSANAFALKLDSNGDSLWWREFPGWSMFGADDIVQLPNGNLVMVGSTWWPIFDPQHFMSMCIDTSGTVIWQQEYTSEISSEAKAVTISDGALYLAGYSSDREAIVVKTDLDGNLIWRHDYPSNEYVTAFDICGASSGGCVVVGDINSWDSTYCAWISEPCNDQDGNGYSIGINEPEMFPACQGGYLNGWYMSLDSPPIVVGTSTVLDYSQRYGCEQPESAQDPYDGWDGMNLRISSDGGVTWDVISDSLISIPYDVQSLYGFGEIFGEGPGVPGWCGINGANWQAVHVNLSPWQGLEVRLRWAFAADGWTNTQDNWQYFGWTLDRIIVSSSGDTLLYENGSWQEAWECTVRQTSRIDNDFYAFRIDSSGDTLWTRTYIGRNSSEIGHSVVPLGTGGFVIAGTAYFGLIGISDTGDSLWRGNSEITDAWSIDASPTNGLLASGRYNFNSRLVRYTSIHDCFVESPNGGELLGIDRTFPIRWSGPCFENPVSIALNRTYPTGDWQSIVDSTDNDGEYLWTASGPVSDSCRIMVSALHDSVHDVSDVNFSIVNPVKLLKVFLNNAPYSEVTEWDAGEIECADYRWIDVSIANLGTDTIDSVVFQPLDGGNYFWDCGGSYYSIAPRDTISYAECLFIIAEASGFFRDTLLIHSDADNVPQGVLRIPLSATVPGTFEPPLVVITTSGANAVLHWSPVDSTVEGCPVSIAHYLVFFSELSEGPFWYHGFTSDTTYVHPGVIANADGMFYHVIASNEPFALLSRYDEEWQGRKIEETEVMRSLRRPAERSVRSED